ncbi:hypothetical protein QVE09_27410 [Paenibacillus sp. ClWae2A]|uniref:hypothetical protein n=1 Tax=Paenibacillus sp. ClWae2A TaxID=3057177 RepID=UPI0028F56BD8|nr:hypothetical protein [Paenibacillus sp. ClWae2A]MDT9722638.1 hypothetical protein [Paenibacillus sp. ClWae2A]
MTLQVFPLISNGDHTRDLYARFKTSEMIDQASFFPPFVLTDTHLLLICTGGEADIRIGHRHNHAALGKMYLILPRTAIEYTPDEVNPLLELLPEIKADYLFIVSISSDGSAEALQKNKR